MKEEDINLVPEDMSLAEIDKLTGVPKPKGNNSRFNFLCRLITLCRAYVSTLLHDQHQQVQGKSATWNPKKRPRQETSPSLVRRTGWKAVPDRNAANQSCL